MACILGTPSGIITSQTGPTLTYIGNDTDFTDQTTYNHGNFTAPSAGIMIVLWGGIGVNARTVSSVSIGGTNGTIIQSNASSATYFAQAYRTVSSGANAVTVTLSGTAGANPTAIASVWFLTGNVQSTPYASFCLPANFTPDSQASHAVSFDYAVNAAALFHTYSGTAASTTAWTNATENVDTDLNADDSFSDAYISGSPGLQGKTVTATLTTSTYLAGFAWV